MRSYAGKSILIVGGGLLQVPAVNIAKSLGLFTIVTDRNPDAPAMQVADCPIAIDTLDVRSHIEVARLAKKERRLAAVFAEGASVEYTVACVAEAVGLHGIHPELALRISNKAMMRRQLANLGVQPADFGTADNYIGALAIAEQIGFPVVIKALDSSGSRGLRRLWTKSEFTEDVFSAAIAHSHYEKQVLIEKMHEGYGEIPEQSVETVWENGKGHWLNWVDRPFRHDRHFAIEIGHYNPADQSSATQRATETLVMLAGRALGMTTGIFKCDVIQTIDGPRILECTARLSGGFDAQYTSPLAHGVNYIRGAMRMALGESIPWEDFKSRYGRHAAAVALFPRPGRITAINGIRDTNGIQGVVRVFLRKNIGEIIEPYVSCVERPAFVITYGDTRADALASADAAIKTIKIETEPV